MTTESPRAGIYCNRTLNLRSIRAIGYDMDYTLVEYKVEEWEVRVYEFVRQKLQEQGWPVEALRFDPDLVIRGLIIDTELGNLVKANRFGYVKRAYHGTRMLPYDLQRQAYARIGISLSNPRYVFLNSLFSLSEACIYMQLVDLMDGGALHGVLGYADLYRRVQEQINEAHVLGRIKEEIVEAPERFINPNPRTALTLLDQKHAGKKLMLITNSEWSYSKAVMAYAVDQFLPEGQTWRDLFDLIIVMARKPDFFSIRSPLFEVVSEEGLLSPARRAEQGRVYLGGNAPLVEEFLGLSGDEILYVGDHLYADVHVTKNILRWRTALILAELEAETAAVAAFAEREDRLGALMAEKIRLEEQFCQLRLESQRKKHGYGPVPDEPTERLHASMNELREQLYALDRQIGPLARNAGELGNERWGLLMRTGNDKSYLARQVERYADIYLSRVSNLADHTPFAYIRSHRGSLPHDPGRDSTPLPAKATKTVENEETSVYDGA